MNKKWRLLDLKLSSFAASTPLVSMLFNLKARGRNANTLAMLTFEKPSVCLFYYNDPEKELDLSFCRERGIEVGRRDTGGSPYWADPGTLLLYLWFDRRDVAGFPSTIPEAYRLLIGAAAAALAERFKIPAVYRPLNDLEVEGKKLAGHTVTFMENAVRWGAGPQVFPPRMELMSRALKVPPEKFADKRAKSVEGRVTNLQDLLGRLPTFQEVKETYVSAVEKILEVKFQPGNLTPEEEGLIGQAAAEGSSPAWLMAMTEERKFGTPRPPGLARGEHVLKVPQGPLIRAVVLMEGEIVRHISLTGSAHCIPVSLIEEMEAALGGVPGKEAPVGDVVREFFHRPGAQMPNCSPEDFVRAILQAVASARQD